MIHSAVHLSGAANCSHRWTFSVGRDVRPRDASGSQRDYAVRLLRGTALHARTPCRCRSVGFVQAAVELTECTRVDPAERAFIHALDSIRRNRTLTAADEAVLRSRVSVAEPPAFQDAPNIFATRAERDCHNQQNLARLTRGGGQPVAIWAQHRTGPSPSVTTQRPLKAAALRRLVTYEGTDQDKTGAFRGSNCVTLCVGAVVRLTSNLSCSLSLCNGTLGTVVAIVPLNGEIYPALSLPEAQDRAAENALPPVPLVLVRLSPNDWPEGVESFLPHTPCVVPILPHEETAMVGFCKRSMLRYMTPLSLAWVRARQHAFLSSACVSCEPCLVPRGG